MTQNKKKKIAYLLTRFPSFEETFISNEIWWLRHYGYDIAVFSLLNPLDKLVQPQSEELMPYVLYCPPLFSWKIISAQINFFFKRAPKYLRALVKTIQCTYREPKTLLGMLIIFPKSVYFAQELEQRGFEHIHAHYVWINGVGAMIISILIGTTFSLHPHAFCLFGRDQTNVRRQLEGAFKIVTESEFHRNYMTAMSKKLHGEDIAVVHCGINIDQFQPADNAHRGNKVIEILCIGRLIEKKGINYLIEACAILSRRNIPFKCSIVGDGSLRDEYQHLIERLDLKDKVFLLGSKKQTETYILYQKSDIFALPCVVLKGGDRDGIPVALMEAMSMKLPVISTAVAGIPELIHNEENGLLVSERDSSALAQALERLINNENLRKEFGEQGRKTVVEGFDVRVTSENMAIVFNSIH